MTILDTIPNEFNTVTAQGGNCNPLTVQLRANREETRISCELPANTDADILVTFQTRNKLSHVRSKLHLYEPTECTLDSFLLVNDGAVAIGPKGDPIAGPSPPLSVGILDCPNLLGAEQEQRQADGNVLPKLFSSNS